jgi:predicted ATPase
MLKALHLKNFTVFPDVNLTFGNGLNVFVGENGSGKTHILKAAYSVIAVSAQKNGGAGTPAKSHLETALADKLQGVFRPDRLGRLVNRQRGRSKLDVSCGFDNPDLDLKFSVSTLSKVKVTKAPRARAEKLPVFLPTRELLTISPGFVSLYETTHLPFEETWRDTCILLGSPLAKGKREDRIKQLLAPLETAMGGKVELDKAGRFYLNLATGSMEMHLVAEGLRKLATVARLIATGSLFDKGYLFWDEPESNLNPKIIKAVALTILQVAKSGIQVFIATHSLFLLRELHILRERQFKDLDAKCFGLHLAEDGSVSVMQGATMDDIGSIASLDEDLQQSDRYIDAEMGA